MSENADLICHWYKAHPNLRWTLFGRKDTKRALQREAFVSKSNFITLKWVCWPTNGFVGPETSRLVIDCAFFSS